MMTTYIDMKLQQTIRRVLNELYSPAGEKHIPNRVVVHKSPPQWRENIKLTGLQVSVGDCYQEYVGGDIECQKAIFATDSLKKRDMFDSTYDDDIWLIDTNCAGVTWYKDKHFEGGDYKYHIVTFEDISPDCLKLIYKGTGDSEDLLEETIRRILREEIGDKKHDKSRLIEKLLYSTFVKSNKDIVCGVEVKHPDDREVLQGQPKYESYSVIITFIGGYGTKYWPRTMAVRDKYDELFNEVWGIVYDYTNTPCDIYSKYVKEC